MLRLTKRADYGLMAMKYLAEHPDGGTHSAKDIAEAYSLPLPVLAKILQALARAELMVSHAGSGGGYTLARPAIHINTFDVIRAIDGPLFITSCVTLHGACDLAGHCTVKEPLRKVNDSIKSLLSNISVADLTESVDSDNPAAAGRLVSIAIQPVALTRPHRKVEVSRPARIPRSRR